MHGLAGKEDVVAIEDPGVGEAAGAEQLGFRDLEEANVGAVEDDARKIHVGPADIVFDDVRRGGHGFPGVA